jgi:hypothetical protein
VLQKDILVLLPTCYFKILPILTVPILSFSPLFLRFEPLNRSIQKPHHSFLFWPKFPFPFSSIQFSSVKKKQRDSPIQPVILLLLFNPILFHVQFLLLLLWFHEFRFCSFSAKKNYAFFLQVLNFRVNFVWWVIWLVLFSLDFLFEFMT